MLRESNFSQPQERYLIHAQAIQKSFTEEFTPQQVIRNKFEFVARE